MNQYVDVMNHLWKLLDQEALDGDDPKRAVAAPYFAAIALVAFGVAVRLAIEPVLGDRLLFLLFLPGVLVGALTGGLGPGLCAALLGCVAGYALLSRGGVVLENRIATAWFGALCILIALGGERLKKAQQRSTEMARRIFEREVHLQSILDTVPDAIIVIDESSRIQFFNPAAETLFGWNSAQVIGQVVGGLVPGLAEQLHDGPAGRHDGAGQHSMQDVSRAATARRRDGSTFPIELSVGEMTSAGRKLVIAFVRDLTERQEAEQRLRQLQSEVVHISRLSAMGEMAATLAHELNQPLSAMSNYLNGGRRLLHVENPRSRALEAMDKAAEQSLRAGQIIRRLRDFVSRGEGEPKIESLPALIEETAALALVGVRELGVEVKFERDPCIDLVLADKVQVQQVLLNLIRNAVEAMESSPERKLLVAVHAMGDMARVEVVDSGPGVSPEVGERLFQPFTTTKDHGMGVGLSICRTIVEAHGGRIWVEPGPSRGASFQFTLRRARGEEFA